MRSYLGTWAGPAVTPAAQSCGGLQWKITSQNGTQASGEFVATCADGIKLSGTMTATHSDTTDPLGRDGNGDERCNVVPVQHDRHGYVSGNVEHPGELRRNDVSGANQRLGDDYAIVTSLFRYTSWIALSS